MYEGNPLPASDYFNRTIKRKTLYLSEVASFLD